MIVGGGIGGLAAAVALDHVGIDSVVLEQASKIDPVGAGIVLSANARLALERLELADAVRAHASVASTMAALRPDGTSVFELELGESLASLGIHRSDLQQVLLQAAGADRVHLNARVTGIDAERPSVRLANGSTEEGDFVVGADGIRSVVRGAGEPRYAGYVGWRAVVDFESDQLRGRFSETWGRGERFGLVPIGGGRLYWFVAEHAVRPDVRRGGIRDELRRRFRAWHDPIPEVLERTQPEAIFGTGIFFRKPARNWGLGPVTILGDAAHAMTPDLGQGAAQALEDAVVLAASLRDAPDVETGLRSYERNRIRRTTPIVRRSRQFGRIAQARTPVGAALRDALFRSLPAPVQRRQQRAIVEHDLPRL